jgi:hypothetical protein
MKSAHAVLATALLFPLMLFAQHGSSSGSGGGGGGGSSSSGSHSSGGSGSRASGGNPGSRGSSSRGAHQIFARQQNGSQARTEQGRKVKDKFLLGTSSVRQEHVKRGWLPWKWHSDKLARNDNHEDKNPKCKLGKPCKAAEKFTQTSDVKKPVCAPGKPCVCPAGTSLTKRGMCESAQGAAIYDDCLGGPLNLGQATGRPCNSGQNDCSLRAAAILREEMELNRVRSARDSACVQNASSQECRELNIQYQEEQARLNQLRLEYENCMHR